MYKIALNMIVKNETKVLPRLLASLKNVVDYYVIVDTGSSDGTQDLIKSIMDDYQIPGEIHNRDWVNFGVNRDQALQLAIGKAEYALIIDADEELINSNFDHLNLDAPCYYITRNYGGLFYQLPYLINIKYKNFLGWKWNGAVHNYLTSALNVDVCNLSKDDIYILSHPNQGAKSHNRSLKEKYLHDAELLLTDLKKNPNDTRAQFYLARSYACAGEIDLAKEAYLKRIQMHGWKEEIVCSYIALIKIYLNENQLKEALTISETAKKLNPLRIKEIYYPIISYYYDNADYISAYELANPLMFKSANDLQTCLFVEQDIENYLFKDKSSMICHHLGKYYEMFLICNSLLLEIPFSELPRVRNNMNYALSNMFNIFAT